jgi:hypothetical protein
VSTRAPSSRPQQETTDRQFLPRGAIVGLALIILALIGIFFGIRRGFLSLGWRQHTGYVVLAGSLGAIVGASELISRYRDEPILALRTTAAFMYLILNATISACAYGLLTRYADAIIPNLAQDQLLTSIVAGFGAMAILRSKFFTLRTEAGEDISVGPDAAVSAFLSAADRGVDRTRASRRLSLVFSRSSEIRPPVIGNDFLEISLAAFQNLDSDDKARVSEKITSVAGSAYPPELKLQMICYAVLGVTGERNFNVMMDNLEKYAAESTTTGGDGADTIT